MKKLYFLALLTGMATLSAAQYSASGSPATTSNPSPYYTNPMMNNQNPNYDSNPSMTNRTWDSNPSNSPTYSNQTSTYAPTNPNMNQVAPQMRTSLNTHEDASVLTDIRKNLTNYQGVSVSVYRGDVTLRGTIGSQSEKDRIEREIRRISGVRTVDNQIQVTSNGSMPSARG